MSITSEQLPPSSSMEQVSKAAVQQREHEIPVWIEEFLKAKFFVSCATHPYIGNHLNRYCITCRMSVCHYCITSGNRHSNHDTFLVYRHVYGDAALLSDLEKHMINCSKILPLKNKQSMVIALKPLPHLSGLSRFTCQTCERRVIYRYSYCCLHCKVAAMTSSKTSSGSSSAPPSNGDQTSSLNNENKMMDDESGRSLHKRKGKPIRAPFF